MLTLNEIRAALKEVRYYYSRQKIFDDSCRIVGHNAVLEKAHRYNEAMKAAPARLYDLYINLYTRNYTQEALSIELGYTPEYIQMLHKQLLLYLQTKIC